jgi:predicted ester cyclase
MPTVDEIRQNIIRMYDETNKGNGAKALHEMLSDDFVSYGGAGFKDLHGPQAFIDLYNTFVGSFPDLKFEILQMVVTQDWAAVRGLQTGTHTGTPFLGMVPAAGKKVSWTGTAMFRLNKDGKICERWQDLDNLKLFQDLGVIPPFGTAQG